jgi:hypothetical protein
VADLVAEDRSELGFGIEMRQEPAGHVDEAAGQGEGVDRGVVDDLEAPGQVGPLAPSRKAAAQAADVGLERIIAHEPVGRLGLPGSGTAHLDLLAFAHEHQLALARGGVRGTGDGD